MFRAARPLTNPGLPPAESVRTCARRCTMFSSSPWRCPTGTCSGSWEMASSTTCNRSMIVFARAFPGRNRAPKHLTSGVREAQHRWNPSPPLNVGAACSLFSEWISTSDESTSDTTGPSPVSMRSHTVSRVIENAARTRGQGRRGDRFDRARQRRVGAHLAEQRAIRDELFDVGARLTATGEHQHRVHQHPATIMSWGAFTSPRDRVGESLAEPDRVSEPTQRTKADVTRHLGAAGLHPHLARAVTLHLASALPGPVT